MTNPFYVNSFVAVPTTTIRAQGDIQQFQAVEAGFDAVEAVLALKATLTSPAFTGTVDMTGAGAVLVPTPGVGGDPSRAASLGLVAAMIGASGTLIPPTASHAGKALMTLDGVTYGWQFPLPVPAGHAGKALTTDGTVFRWQYVVPPPASGPGKVPRVSQDGLGYTLEALTGLASGGIQTCSVFAEAGDRTVLDISGCAIGTLVRLPDARTLAVGTSYVMSQRTGTNVAALLDAANNMLTPASNATGVAAVLADNSTLAGTWKLMSEGFALSSPLTSFLGVLGPSTNVSTTPSHTVKFMLPIGGDDFLHASGETSSHSVKLRWLRATGLTITEIANATLAAAGSAVNRVEILALASGSFVLIRRCTGSNDTYATAFKVSGSSITVGLTVNIQAIANSNPATSGNYGLAWSAAVNGDKVLMLLWANGTPGVTAIAFGVAGTTITVGTKADIRATVAGLSYGSVAACPEADKWVVSFGTEAVTVGVHALVVTASALALTLHTEQQIVSTCGVVAVKVASSTKAFAAYIQKSTTDGVVVDISISGNSLVIGTPVVAMTGLSSDAGALVCGIELFPGNLAYVYFISGAGGGAFWRGGAIGTGAWVNGPAFGNAAAAGNINICTNRLGDVGFCQTVPAAPTSVIFALSDMSLPGTLTVFSTNHALGANAPNSTAILLPDGRVVFTAGTAGTNVTVQATKLRGF